MGLDLKQVCEYLESDKVKERQEGIAAIHEAFAREHVVRNFDDKKDGRAWLTLFQALFSTVKKERQACIKNPTAVALRRLEDAARAVRWLVERSVPYFNRRAFKPLLAHLQQSLAHQNQLLRPLAADYVKSLRVVVAGPHGDHLDDAQWRSLLSLAFAILLRKPLDMDMYEVSMDDGEEEEEEDDFGSTPEPDLPRKRARTASVAPPAKRRKKSSAPPQTEEQKDSAAIVRALVGSRFLPCAGPELDRILALIQSFFAAYPSDTTAHQDILPALNLVLARATLNARASMVAAAPGLWDPLAALWGTKGRASKEALVIALQYLFPFVVLEDEIAAAMEDGISRVVRLIDEEPDARLVSVPVLSLDALRLDVDDEERRPAFVAQTFRAGTQFSSEQALSWAALELQADCLHQLHRMSDVKRSRTQDPISAFLASLQKPSTADRRYFRLQTLLFLVDRHWAALHQNLQTDVVSVLMTFLSHDDLQSQAWAFLCFAAVAHAGAGAVDWDVVWNHAIRRASVAAVCRAACHVARVLLLRDAVSHQRVLADIEALAKDITIQGPALPHDAVCAFLALCLRRASQDARLYKMQLEDQVLAWLGDRPAHQHTRAVRDVLNLLEAVCGLARRSNVPCAPLLPDCAVVEVATERHRTALVHDFMLHARLPYLKPSDASSPPPPDSPSADAGELITPRTRERKASAFLLKSLEAAEPQLETPATAEHLRTAVDLAVLALCFEASLELHGTRPTRRVVQTACRVIAAVRRTDLWKWTWPERAQILCGFEPLVRAGADNEAAGAWEVLVGPGAGSGIERDKLVALQRAEPDAARSSDRRRLQRLIWRSADVQDEFAHVFKMLRGFLLKFVTTDDRASNIASGAERDDEFAGGAVQVGQALGSAMEISPFAMRRVFIANAVHLLAVSPMLQSDSSAPTRDKELLDLLLQCNGILLLQLGPQFCECVSTGAFYLGKTGMAKLFAHVREELLLPYAHAQNDASLLFIIQFLESTIDIWLSSNVAGTDLASEVRQVCSFFAKRIAERTWRVRDRWVAFSSRCLALEPAQTFWSEGKPLQNVLAKELPAASVVDLMNDPDMLVRTRALVASTRLLVIVPLYGIDVSVFYMNVLLQHLTKDLFEYELVVSRILALANYMIVNSAVRRGPFWHLLEPLPFHSPTEQIHPGQRYRTHIQSALEAVARRLGMDRLSALFEAYIIQLVHSFLTSTGKDFFFVPPQVLGYTGRRELAEASFATAAPVLLLYADDPQTGQAGRQSFARYCEALNMTTQQGLVQCFSSCVGLQISFWIQSQVGAASSISAEQSAELYELALDRARQCDADEPKELLARSVDGIVSGILRTLGDIDYTKTGVIVQQLSLHPDGDRAVKTFNQLMQFRSSDDFEMHAVNLPAMSTATIIRTLSWLKLRLPDVDAEPTIYHVLHQIFAAVSSTPLLNEKLRMLQGLCIWVSINSRKFSRPALLRTLILGATVLLGFPDLARFAHSILAWAFTVYRATASKQQDSVFPDAFSRMGRTSYSFACDGHDKSVRALGVELLDWFEAQLEDFASVENFRDQVVTIINLWPRRPRGQLINLGVDGERTDTLSSILSDPRLTSNKFKLVMRLRDFAQRGDYPTSSFSTGDFWKIKASMPDVKALLDEDIDAFVDLLFMSQAQLVPVTDQPTSYASIAQRHRSAVRHRNADTSPRNAIVHALLAMLSADDVSSVHLAYSTLRLIVPIRAEDEKSSDRDKSDKDELAFLSQFTPSLRNRPAREITTLLTDPSFTALAEDFPSWVRSVSVLLTDSLARDDPFWGQLATLLQRDAVFAEEMFPVLVHAVVAQEYVLPDSADPTSSAKAIVSEFFSCVLALPAAAILSIRCIVRAVLHLRSFMPLNTVDVLAYERWLDLDYDLLARGAIACGAYTTALLFLELAAEFSRVQPAPAPPEDILYEVYSRIDEPDGFYGIKSKDVLNLLVRRFHHEGEWDKAFHFHGAEFEGAVGASDSQDILNSLHAFGFNNLSMTVLQSGASSLPSELHLGYKIGWRTDTWDLPDPLSDSQPELSLYRSLRAVHRERNEQVAQSVLSSAIRREVDRLRSTGNENLVQIRSITQTLMSLREIRYWQDSAVQSRIMQRDTSDEAWSDFTSISPHFDFQDQEAILATRMSLLRSVRLREQRDQIGNAPSPFVSGLLAVETRCLVRLSEAARTSQRAQIALNAIVKAQQLERSHQDLSFDVAQEFAGVLWMQKEQKMAIEFLRELLQQRHPDLATPTDNVVVNKQRAILLARVGGWASEARLQKPTDIREQYFDPATNLLVVNNYSQSNAAPDIDPGHATIFYQAAVFAEHQYHTILDSTEVTQLLLYKQRKVEELQLLKRQQTAGVGDHQQLHQQTRKTKALLDQDSTQLELYESTRDAFRSQAVEMFSRCLCASDEFDDDAVIRLCSIWTANFHLDDDAFHDVVQAAMERVPSRKFVFLAHQLSARLSNEHEQKTGQRSQRTLQSLMWRICSEHPFHSLYQVFSLRRAAEPEPGPRRRTTTTTTVSPTVSPALSARANAATELANKLKQAENTRKRSMDVERLCIAFLEWAQFPLKDKPDLGKKGSKEVPGQLLIRTLRDIKVPITTVDTPVDPLMRYDNIVYIKSYSSTFNTAGGVNLPKIMDCIGSDGRQYKQLFKGEGNDDLRQDAVMEQVFQLCNKVLQRDRETAKRKLHIRPYKVVPLSPKAGMLEFVTNTTPLGEWLPAAHQKYYKGDMPSRKAQDTLRDIQNDLNTTPADKAKKLLAAFLKIRSKCRPVMRFFFRERHKDPMAWFAMRLNYARSAATTSIVGHVLGLGDRHISNILIDKYTGELIHIDLGIAFEQGKLLPIPETVPFRLTADIVDGLGTTGPEGVFRRCAEQTLRVLHDGSEVIKLVLEVFKHDPLHSWYAGVKLRAAQRDARKETAQQSDRFGIGIDADSNPEVEAADRALSSVARKLDRSMSVEYTVNELITTAMDPANLSRIFWGWNPQY